MGKFMKPNKVVIVLQGRYAGRKAIIVKVSRSVNAFGENMSPSKKPFVCEAELKYTDCS